MIKDDELIEKHHEILEKVRNSVKQKFESEPVYNKNYLKIKSNKLKKNLTMEQSAQIFSIIRYQKKVLNELSFEPF